MTVWILTKDYADYDQHGDYFVAVFASKPTAEQLKAHRVPEHEIPLVLAGAERKEGAYCWFFLNEEVPE